MSLLIVPLLYPDLAELLNSHVHFRVTSGLPSGSYRLGARTKMPSSATAYGES